MGKVISDELYFKKIITPDHHPVIVDTGDQRDPMPTIICSCAQKDYKNWRNAPDFMEHIFEIIKRQFIAPQGQYGDH